MDSELGVKKSEFYLNSLWMEQKVGKGIFTFGF